MKKIRATYNDSTSKEDKGARRAERGAPVDYRLELKNMLNQNQNMYQSIIASIIILW